MGLDQEAAGDINVMSPDETGVIHIPGRLWLEHAKFLREGPDLVLVGNDGTKMLVADYFRMEPRPALLTESGGSFSPELVGKLAGPEAPGQFAQAASGSVAQPIGRIETIAGPVEVTRADGTRVTAAKGDPVFSGDVVETGAKGAVSLLLADDSVFSLADNGRIVLDEMVYDPGQQTGKLGLSLVTGVMSFVSGQIAKTDPDAMVLSTPVATVGIRGTTGSINSGTTLTIVLTRDPNGTTGEIAITTPSGVQVLNSNFAAASVAGDGTIQSFTMTAAQLQATFGASLSGLNAALSSLGLSLPDATNQSPSDGQTGQDSQKDPAFVPVQLQEQLQEAKATGDQLKQLLANIDQFQQLLAFKPPVVNTDVLQTNPVLAAEVASLTADYSTQASTIVSMVSQLATLSSMGTTAETAAASALISIGTEFKARAQRSSVGLTDEADRTSVNEVITGPLTSFGTASAVSAAAYGVMTTTALVLKTLGTATTVDAGVLAHLTAATSAIQIAATKATLLSSATVQAASVVSQAALAGTNPGTNGTSALRRDAALNGLFGGGTSKYQQEIEAALATLNAGSSTHASLDDLSTLLDDVITELQAAWTIIHTNADLADLTEALEITIDIAGHAGDAAENARSAAIAHNAADLKSFSAAALEATTAARDTVNDLEDALPIHEILATLHPSVVDEALTALNKVDDADVAVSQAVAAIEAASKTNVDVSALVTSINTLRGVVDTRTATLAQEQQEAEAAANALVAARALLAGKVVTEATNLAISDAYHDAYLAAVAKEGTALDQVFSASVSLGPLDRTQSLNQLETIYSLQIVGTSDPNDGLEGDAATKRAAADAAPGDAELDALADLAEQQLANAQAALSFVQQLKSLIVTPAYNAYQDALSDYNSAHAAADAQRALVATALTTSQTELAQALAASDALAHARVDLAKAEMELYVAETAKRVEAEVTLDLAVDDAKDAYQHALAAHTNGNDAQADTYATAAQEAADEAAAAALSDYAPANASTLSALAQSFADGAADYANGPAVADTRSARTDTAAVDAAAAADAAATAAALARTHAENASTIAAQAATYRAQAAAAETANNQTAARAAANAAALLVDQAAIEAAAAKAASTKAQDYATEAGKALKSFNPTAASEANRALDAAGRALLSENLADSQYRTTITQAAEADASADLQDAKTEAAGLAQQAAADAVAAAQAAAAAAQAAANQAAQDKSAADTAAINLAHTLYLEAKSWADQAAAKALETDSAADDVDLGKAGDAAAAARAAADKAAAAAQAAFDAASGAGPSAFAEAQAAADQASSARTSAGNAAASLAVAQDSLSASDEWRDGSASADRAEAVAVAARAAAAASKAATAASSAATAAATAVANTVSPHVALAAAEAAVSSQERSLALVEAKREAADDGDDTNTSAIEAVWDSAISQAQGALADAKAARTAAQAASDAADAAATLAQDNATAAARAAAESAANAAAASTEAGFAQAFEIGAQGAAQARADGALAFITAAVATAIATAEQKATAAAAAATTAATAADQSDSTGATNAARTADDAAVAAQQAIVDAVNSIIDKAAVLGLGTYAHINSINSAIATLNSLAADAEALDDLASDITVQPTQALLDAQSNADSAQAAKQTFLSASITSAVQAARSAIASAQSADAEAAAVGGLEADKLAAAEKALDAAQAAANAADDKAQAALQDATSTLAAAQTRLANTQATLAARDAAQASAQSASEAAARAAAALTSAHTSETAALSAKNSAATALAAASAGASIDPAAYATLQNAYNAALAAYNKASSAVSDADQANNSAQLAKADAARYAAVAVAEAAKVDLAKASAAVTTATADKAAAQTAAATAHARALSADALAPDSTPSSDEVRALVTQAKLLASQASTAATSAESAALDAQTAYNSAPRAVAARAAAQSAADSAAQAAVTASGIAQVDTVTIGGAIENGDSYSITVNGQTVTYTVNLSSGVDTLAEVRDQLVSAVNNAAIGQIVAAASADGSGSLTLTALAAGVAFTSGAAAHNGGVSNNTASVATTTGAGSVTAQTKQVDTVTLAGTVEAHDTYGITINGTTVSYQATASDDLNSVRTALINLANGQSAITDHVTVTAGTEAGVIVVTAIDGGVEFTASASAVNGGSLDNTATVTTVVGNLKGADDLATAAAETASAQATIAQSQLTAALSALAIVQKSIRADAIATAAATAAATADLNADDDSTPATANYADAAEELGLAKTAATLARAKADAAVAAFSANSSDPALAGLASDARTAANDAATAAAAAQTAATAAKNALIAAAQTLGLTLSAQTATAAASAITTAANAIIADSSTTSVAKALAAGAVQSAADALASYTSAQNDATTALQAATDADAQADLAENVDEFGTRQADVNRATIQSADQRAETSDASATAAKTAALAAADDAIHQAETAMIATRDSLTNAATYLSAHSTHPDAGALAAINAAKTAAAAAVTTIHNASGSNAGSTTAAAINGVIGTLDSALALTHQYTTFTFGGAVTGQTFTINIPGQSAITVNNATTLAGLRDAFVAAIEGGAAASVVTAQAGFNPGEVRIYVDDPTNSLTLTATASNGTTPTKSTSSIDSALASFKSGLTVAADVANTVQTAVTNAVTAADAAHAEALAINPSAFATVAPTSTDVQTAIANADGVTQHSTVTLGGTVEGGDVYRLTVNGINFTYTANGTETLAQVRSALITLATANPSVAQAVTIASGTAAGEISLTAKTPGVAFTVSALATDHGSNADNSAATLTDTTNAKGADDYAADAAANAALARAQANQAQQAANQAVSGASQFQQALEKANQEDTLATAQEAANALPDAINDNANVNEDQSITVSLLANDKRADGQTLLNGSITTVGAPAHGKVVIVPQVDTITLSGTPGASDTYTITVNGKSATYTAPSGTPDFRQGIIDIINNNADLKPLVKAANGATSDKITLTAVTPGMALQSSVGKTDVGSANNHAISVATTTANGSVTYTPTSNFNGTDSFTYTVANNATPPSYDTATVTVSVASVNDAPILVADFGTVITTAGVTIAVLGNDTDVDNDALSVSSITYNSITNASSVSNNGVTITKNANNTITYVPSPSVLKALAQGQTQTDTFTYTASDGHGGTATQTVTVTLTGSNDAPEQLGVNVGAGTVTEFNATEDTAKNGSLVAVDPDTGATLTYSIAAGGAPLHGTLTLNGTNFVYTPTANYAGDDAFTFRVVDQFNAVATKTITVHVQNANDAPVAVNDAFSAIEDGGAVTMNVLANDTDIDTGDSKFIVSANSTAGATITFGTGANATLSYNPNGVSQFNSLGQGQTTTDTVTYVMRDAAGATSTATVTVTITGTNDAPSATSTNVATNEDTLFTGVLAAADVDQGSLLRFTIPTGSTASHGTVTLKSQIDTVAIGANGLDTGDRVTMTINGTSVQYTHTGAATQAAVAAGLSTFINANSTFANLVTAAVGATAGTVTLTSKVAGQQFIATATSGDMTVGAATTVPNGAYTYLPSSNYNGSDSFTYRVVDQYTQSAEATVTVTVGGDNDPPTAMPDTGTVKESDGDKDFSILANDTDPDSGDTASTFRIVSASSQRGAVVTFDANEAGGKLTYNPSGVAQFNALGAGQSTTDTVTYVMRDSTGATSASTLTITINGENDNPVATPDAFTVTAGSGTVTLNVLANDTDVDANDPVSSFTITQTVGAATIAGNSKSLQFDTNAQEYQGLGAGQTAQTTVFYRMADAHGGTDNGSMTGIQVVVTVTGVNDGPVAVADTGTTDKATALTFTSDDFLGNDTDIDFGDTKQLVSVQSTSSRGATIVQNQDGSYTYDPSTSTQIQGLSDEANLQDTFTYTMRDAAGATSTATVTVTVSGHVVTSVTNDALVATSSDDIYFSADGGNDTLDTNGYAVTYEVGLDYLFAGAAANGNDLVFSYVPFENPTQASPYTLTVLNHYSSDPLDQFSFYSNEQLFTFDVATQNDNSGALEDLLIVGRASGGGKDVIGGSGDDLIFSGTADSVDGGTGNDTIYGSSGVDLFHASSGNDFIYAGGGTDSFIVGDNFNMRSGELIDADFDGTVDDLRLYFTEDAPAGMQRVFDVSPDDQEQSPEGVETTSPIDLANQSFSWEVWANANSTADSALIGQGDLYNSDSGNKELFIGYRGGNFVFSFDSYDTQSEQTTRSALSVTVSNTDDADTWVHWAGTYNAANGHRELYRNGILVASDTAGAPYSVPSDHIDVGIASQANTFSGDIGNVSMWQGVLSPSQIADGMNGDIHDFSSAYFAYNFGYASGQTVYDQSPNQNNGLMVNGGAFVSIEGTLTIDSATFINQLGLNGETAQSLSALTFTNHENNTSIVETYHVATSTDNSSATGPIIFAGTSGDDNVTGSDYGDIIIGNGGNDVINAGDGDDFIMGGGGSDFISGGAGNDTVTYADEDVGIIADLANETVSEVGRGQGGNIDTLLGIENIEATGFADELTGDSGTNVLRGEGGDDDLTGAGGADILAGGEGSDVYRYVSKTDSTVGSTDTINDFNAQEDQIEFTSMSGVSYTGRTVGYTDLSSTLGAIVADTSLANSVVFFSDGTDGYLYVNGSGSGGTDFDGTLIKLKGVTAAPATSALLGPDNDTPPTILGAADSGYALDFNGTTDFVRIPNSSSMRFTDTQDFTWEAWVKADSSNRTVFDNGHFVENTWVGARLQIDNSGRFAFFLGDDTQSASVYANTDSSVVGEWHHVAVSVDRSGIATIYVDGSAEGSNNVSAVDGIDAMDGLLIGTNAYHGNFFDGQIDDVRVWGTARSAQDIADNMNRTDVSATSQLHGQWLFDAVAGDGSSPDRSVYANDAEVGHGAPLDPFAKVLTLDNTNESYPAYIQVHDTNVQNVNPLTPNASGLTVETWFYWNGSAAYPGGTQTLISKGLGAGPTDGYALRLNRDNAVDYLEFDAALGGSLKSKGLDITALSAGWHHVAMSLDVSGDALNGYLDGVPMSSGIQTFTDQTFPNDYVMASLTDLTIGRDANGDQHYYSGQLSDLRVWREVRSAQDILDNYDHRIVNPAGEQTLAAYWRFDGDLSTDSLVAYSYNAQSPQFRNDGSPDLTEGADNLYTLTIAAFEDQPKTFQIAAADDDFFGTVTFSVDQTTQHGALTHLGNGNFTYTPSADFYGTDVFTLRATDSTGRFSTRDITIAVADVPEPTVVTHNVSGTDTVAMTSDYDAIIGSGGDDTIALSGAATAGDTVDLGTGTDMLALGNSGNVITVANVETVMGGSGNDVVTVGSDDAATDVFMDGGAGSDALYGGNGNDILSGGIGDDILKGNGGADMVSGGLGNDRILAGFGAGDDSYDGGTGTDWLEYPSTSQGIIVNLASGVATGTEIGTDNLSNIENVLGGSGADSITGDSNANYLKGAAGEDQLFGMGGTDILEGGLGADQLTGGGGDDVYVVRSGDSTLAAMDTIVDFALGLDAIRYLNSDGTPVSGLAYTGRTVTYTSSLADTIQSIESDTQVQNEIVFFSDSGNGYLYTKASGAADGTLVQLQGITSAPAISDIALVNHAPDILPPYSALLFDGVDDRVTAPLAIADASGDVTIEARFNWSGPTSGSQVIAYNGDTGAGGFGFFLDYQGHLTVLSGGVAVITPVTSFTPILGEWTHVALTHTSDTTWHLYIDGAEVPLNQTTGGINTPSGDVLIGANSDANAFGRESFNGLISDVAIWNVARSASDLAAHYDDPLTGSESGLAAYWRLGDAVNGTAADVSSHNLDATLETGSAAPTVVVSTDEDVPLNGTLLATDADGDAVTFTVQSNAATTHGHVTVDADGTFIYTPDANYHGSDSFTVQASDGFGGVDTQIINVSIASVNDPVQGVNDTATTSANTSVLIDVLANDVNTDNLTLTISGILQQPSHGSVAIENGQIRYTPTNGYVGNDQFVYAPFDGTGSSPAYVTVTVTPQDEPLVVLGATNEPGSVQFDGKDDRISTALTSLATDFTISAWFKTGDDPADGTYKPILSKQDGGDNYSAEFDLQVRNDGNLNFFAGSGSDYLVNLDGGVLQPNTWYNVAVAVSGTNQTATMYLNGAPVDTDTFAGSRITGSAPIEIGHYSNGTEQFWDGQVAEVQVWSTARTAQDIADSYSQTIENPQIQSDLAGYWRLDQLNANGGFDDLSSGNHDATLGLPTTIAPVSWLNGPALSLDGTDADYVQATGGPGALTAITLEAWINPHSIDNENAIVAKGASFGATTLFNVTTGGYLAFYSANASQWVYSTTPVAAGEWSHVAVSFDPTAGGAVEFYVDGIPAGTTTSNGSVSSDTNIGIGTQSGYGDRGNPFDGEISDVRIWNDVRTASEIADNMDQRLQSTESSLVGYWALDGNLIDQSATHATATITGATFESPAPIVLGPNVARAMDFNGSTDSVIATGVDLANKSFSWEFWSFRDAASPNANIVLGQGTPDTNVGLHVGYYGTQTSGDLSHYFIFAFWNNDLAYLNPTDDTGQWVHWAGTYDAVSNERKLYKNGVLVAEDNTDNRAPQFQGDYQGTGPLLIGAGPNGDNFDGKVADVRIWNDVRTADEIHDNMSNFVPWDSQGLVSNWRLDDTPTGVATAAADATNTNNGTVIGNPDYVTNAAPIYTTDVSSLEDTMVRGTIAADDDGAITYTIASGPAHGEASIDANGNYSYLPDVDYHGSDSFVVNITPQTGSPQVLTINVTVDDDTSPAIHLVSGSQTIIPKSNVADLIKGSDGADAVTINGPMETGDVIDLGSGMDSVLLNYGGNGNTVSIANVESFQGSNGADHVTIAGSELTGSTYLDGGVGSDELIITTTSAITLTSAQLYPVASFETWTLGSDQSYSITLSDNNIQITGDTLTVDGSDVTHNISINASAETNGVVHLIGGDGNDLLMGGAGADILDGGAGVDRVSYVTAASAAALNLATGTGTVNGVIDTLIGIESVTGTLYADTLTGSDNSNVYEYVAGIDHPVRSQLERFAGLAGNDIINGGAGNDQADYSQDAAAGGTNGVTVNLATGTATDGFGNTDTLTSIEFVRGTAFADTLTGSNNASGTVESFVGLGGNDIITGGGFASGGTDRADYSQDASFGGTAGIQVNLSNGSGTVIDGFGSTDTLTGINDITGTDSIDTIVATTLSSGFQTFAGLAGNDTIFGSGTTGLTQVDYSRDAAAGGLSGVTVNLDNVAHNGVASGTATDGFGDTDTLSGIRGARGTQVNDAFYGGTADERFRGLGGDDYIDGGGGTNEVDYSNDANFGATHGVIVSLEVGTATDGFGDTDTLVNLQNVTGSSFADTITGNSGNNVLGGGVGYDTLTGRAGTDTFVSSSGGGLDTITDFSITESDKLSLSSSANAFTYSETLNALVISSTGQGFKFAAGTGLDDVNFNSTNILNGIVNGNIMSMVDNSAGLTGGTGNDFLLLTGTTSGKTASGGSGNDRIRDSSGNGNTLMGGDGSDVIIGLGGSDTINLTETTSAVDTVVYAFTTDGGTSGDTITQFGSTDIISFTDVGSADFLTLLDRDDDGSITNEKVSVSGVLNSVDYRNSSLFVISSALATVLTLSDTTLAAAAINTAITGGNHSEAGLTSVFVLSATIGTSSGVYVFVDANGDAAVSSSELTLLATVDAGLSIANFSGTTNDLDIVGTSGNDTLYGGIDNDTFTVSGGSDVYYTGGGIDTLDFGTSYDIESAETVGNDLVFTYTANNADSPLYTATIASHLMGGFELDEIRFEMDGDMRTLDVATTFDGSGLTRDTAFAGTSDMDTMTGGSGDDILLGNGGNDALNGGAGDDWLVGGDGDDQIVGGSNDSEGDTVAFFSSPAGVIVDLSAGTSCDGWGHTDTLSGIENVDGSDHNDTIIGNSSDNQIRGEGGADILTGGAGNDRFIYRSEGESGTMADTRDTITDFVTDNADASHDQIDISALVQGTFSFIGTAAFTTDGSTHARFESNGDNAGLKLIEIDTDGDSHVDMQIQMDQTFDAAHLDTSDFKHQTATV